MYTYPNVPRCHHIKINGMRCGSPALRRHNLCFFHQRWHDERVVMPRKHPGCETTVELPVLEDANSIQMALTQVMRLILLEKIDKQQARLLLYALQIASRNLSHTLFEPLSETKVVIDPATLASSGIGVDSWTPTDFPARLPAEPTPEASFTPDPAQPVFYDATVPDAQEPAAQPASALAVGKKPSTRTPDPVLIPEIKAEASVAPARSSRHTARVPTPQSPGYLIASAAFLGRSRAGK